jgi:hypothetical protein
MNIDKLVKLKADQKLININPLFFKECLNSFKYLIFDFSFDKARLNVFGRGCSVIFLNGKAKVQITYEIGLLPQLYLEDKEGNRVDPKRIIPKWEQHISRDNFPIHFKVQDVINTKYNSVKDYIKAMGQAWDKNKEAGFLEVKKCLELQGTELRNSECGDGLRFLEHFR